MSRRKTAFTLVELLTVIAVIAVLVTLLLPLLTKARRTAAQVACLSNLRQLGTAMIAYAQANNGWLPAPACGAHPRVEDWVHWEPTRDFADSSIIAYLGRDAKVLTCPLGPAEVQPLQVNAGAPRPPAPPYPFSYSVNVLFTGVNRTSPGSTTIYWEPAACKLSSARNSSHKILVIEEDTRMINDGAWFPPGFGGDPFSLLSGSSLSARHDSGGREIGPGPWNNKRGNAIFADGHGAFVRRELTVGTRFIDPWLSNDTDIGPWE